MRFQDAHASMIGPPMRFRKPAVLAILALVLAASADGQVVSPPPICFSFNDAAPLPFGLPTAMGTTTCWGLLNGLSAAGIAVWR
jgi:hypothetical protein